MTYENISVPYGGKKLELAFMAVSAYWQTSMVLKDYCASICFAVADVKFFRTLVCIFATPFEVSLLLSDPQISKVAAIAEEKRIQAIWRTHFAEKKAKLFHRRYVVHGGLADASEIRKEVLSLVERPA